MKPLQTLRNIAHSKGGQELAGWLSHGAVELANVMVHGHPAPMYAHNAAPPDQPAPEQAAAPNPEEQAHNESAQRRDTEHASAKLERASQEMNARMEAPQQSQQQEMSR